jgi:hypothetical protein
VISSWIWSLVSGIGYVDQAHRYAVALTGRDPKPVAKIDRL